MLAGDGQTSGVPHAAAILEFVDAVLRETAAEADKARVTLRAAVSDAAFVDICATIASFNAVVIIADGTGIPLEADKAERTAAMRDDLDLTRQRLKQPTS